MDTISKIIVTSRPRFGILGFRFGPSKNIKIEVSYDKYSGSFSACIVEGMRIGNIEKVFEKEIEKAKQEIINELTFTIRRKQIIEKYETKKIKKTETDRLERKLEKKAFDEITSRMSRMRNKNNENVSALIKKEDVPEYEHADMVHFGDTTKIINRRTRLD